MGGIIVEFTKEALAALLSGKFLLFLTFTFPVLLVWNIWIAKPNPEQYQRWIDEISHPNYGTFYRSALTKYLRTITFVIGDKSREVQQTNYFSARAFLFCIALAISYPTVLVVAAYSLGLGGSFSSLGELPTEIEIWRRVTAAGGLVVTAALSLFAGKRFDSSRKGDRLLAIIALILSAQIWWQSMGASFSNVGSFSFISLSFVVVFVFARRYAFATAFSISYLFFSNLVFGIAFGLVGGFTLVVITRLADRIRIGVPTSILLAAALAGLSLAGWIIRGIEFPISPLVEKPDRVIAGRGLGFVLLVLLPTANALFDWISLGFSRFLLGRLADGTHKGLSAFFWAFADLLLGIVCLLFVGVATVVTLSLADTAAMDLRGSPAIGVGELLENMYVNPENNSFLWIYAMALTTLLWTAIHVLSGVLAGITTLLTTFPVLGRSIRNFVRAKMMLVLESGDAGNAARAWIASFNAIRFTVTLAGIWYFGFLVWLGFSQESLGVSRTLIQAFRSFIDIVLIPAVRWGEQLWHLISPYFT